MKQNFQSWAADAAALTATSLTRSSSAVPVVSCLVCVAALLAACGGGGGDAGTAASTLEFPVASTVSAFATTPHQFNLAGSVNGKDTTVSYRQTPGALSSFEGKPASTAVQSVAFRVNGALASETTETLYFAVNPFVAYGSINQADGRYSVTDQPTRFPATAKVGQSGVRGSTTEYVDAQKSQIKETSTLTWSLEADTASTALLCLNTALSSAPPFTGSECYRIDANGMLSGLVLKISFDGKTWVLN